MQLDTTPGGGGMHIRSATQKFHIDITAYYSLNLMSHCSNCLSAGLDWGEKKKSISVRIY